MKSKILTLVFLSVFLFTQAQDNKPGLGDIGVHYGVNFNGALQQYIGVSGIITDHFELGGVLSFSYTHSNTNSSMVGTADAISNPELPVTITKGNKGNNYSVGISPYLLYHFPIKSNLDLYLGPIISVGFSNNNNHLYQTTSGVNYMQTEDELTSQPATINMAAGGLLGCQYFFYKNLALGVQAGLNIGYSITKGNMVDIGTISNSGSDNALSGSNSANIGTATSENSHSFNLSTAASAGVSLAFYFSRKAK